MVWFGEAIPPVALKRSESALACDVFLTVGTSSQVYPAAGLMREARRAGAFSVEINPEATPGTGDVDLVLQGAAEDVLVRLDAALGEISGDAEAPTVPGKVR